jgi:hypothetical protein
LSLDFGTFEKDFYHMHTKEGEEIGKILESWRALNTPAISKDD